MDGFGNDTIGQTKQLAVEPTGIEGTSNVQMGVQRGDGRTIGYMADPLVGAHHT